MSKLSGYMLGVCRDNRFPVHFFYAHFLENWKIIALLYCVGSCHTTAWISRMYPYIPSLVNLPPTPSCSLRCVSASAELLQSCLTLCDSMDCSLPDSSAHGILREKKYWSGLPFPPPGNLPERGIEPKSLAISCIGRWILYHWATWEALCSHKERE